MGSHWMFAWLDQRGVRDARTLREALSSDDTIRQLIDLANRDSSTTSPAAKLATVAGVGFDLNLSHDFGCMSSPAREYQVNELLNSVCHYFDSVYVDDALGHALREHHGNLRALRVAAYAFGSSLLSIRRLGAEHFVSFLEKRHLDEETAPEVLGPDEFYSLRETLVPAMIDEAQFSIIKRRGHGVEYTLAHPGIPNPATGKIPRELRKAKKAQLYVEAADQVLQTQMWWLTRDLICARQVGMPLTLATGLQEVVLTELRRLRPRLPEAIDIRLPVLNGLSPSDILRLREDEREAFERFRTALRQAMAEAPGTGRSMAEIQRDLVEPELNALTQRLKTAERAFGNKAGYGVALGTVTAVCGLMTGFIQVTGAGVAAAIGAAVAAQGKLQDERREVQLSDMYFVWKATR